MAKRIAILGGGVAGLSAAHELIERGFEVDVYEANPTLGGKARSQPVSGTGTGGRDDLPGEHGFRFYPRFYRHLIDTMERIPLPDGHAAPGASVADNLRDTTQSAIAPTDAPGLVRFYRRYPDTPLGIVKTVELFYADMNADPADVTLFAAKMLQYVTSCRERRLYEYEPMSWWEFLRGDQYSKSFQTYLTAVPRTLVAMNPHVGSARSLGDVSIQLLMDFATSGVNNDRTMNGPSSEAWIEPWRIYLEARGVRFHLERPILGFEVAGNSVVGVRVRGEAELVTADTYVAALPIDVMQRLIDADLAALDPQLDRLRHVDMSWMTAWMTGVQFFLYEEVPTVAGHIFYPHSPWALTSISQPQFWRDRGLFRRRYGNGEVGGLLSVNISDWDTPGELTGKPAKHCTKDEVIAEVWHHLKASINDPERPMLRDDLLHSAHLDEDIVYPDDGSLPPENRASLLVHPPGSWAYRPEVTTAIPNLLLASDYVRTDTDLATMEAANEAARRAVNAILDREGAIHDRAGVWEHEEPAAFAWAQERDQRRFEDGDPHLFDSLRLDSLFGPAQLARRAARRVGLYKLEELLSEYRVTRGLEWFLRQIGYTRRQLPTGRP